jgi:hypothetical protein
LITSGLLFLDTKGEEFAECGREKVRAILVVAPSTCTLIGGGRITFVASDGGVGEEEG